jgi:outer membrane PBP1 activator LpoA protein
MITATLLISACVSTETKPEDVPPTLFSELEADATFYLNKDSQLGSDTNLAWQFLAIQALISERKFVLADAVIDSLQNKPLTPEQASTLALLIADKFYAQNKLSEAQVALTDSNYQILNATSFMHYLKLQSTVYIENKLPFEASETLLLLTPQLVNDNEKQSYNDLLLAQLIQLPAKTLRSFVSENDDLIEEDKSVNQASLELNELVTDVVTQSQTALESGINKNKYQIEPKFKSGWYALALLYQEGKLRPNRLSRALNDWKATYSDHSVLAFLPTVLTNISTLNPYQPDNIAILLPLSGRFERQGKAIQFGLMNAYYLKQKTLESEGQKSPTLHFFDTQSFNSEQLALKIKQANVDFVIGPLVKQEIEDLLPLIGSLPMLALNRFTEQAPKTTDIENGISSESGALNESKPVAWHYSFTLSPEDEARQGAKMIHADKHKYPLIIAEKSNYGMRVADSFKTQWAELTPGSDAQVEVHYFQSTSQLAKFMEEVLQTGQSKSRISQMRSIVGRSMETEVRSRRDVDAIYIVSKRDELILLKPFIDVSVSPFAESMPLYASSRSHSNDRFNMQNKELSQLVFSDNPFLLNQYTELNQEVQKAWGKQSFSTLRTFALGFDSYQIIDQLVYLQNNENTVYKGLVGELSLDSNNNVGAKLSWATYQDGALFEVTSPIPAE